MTSEQRRMLDRLAAIIARERAAGRDVQVLESFRESLRRVVNMSEEEVAQLLEENPEEVCAVLRVLDRGSRS